MKSGKDEGKQVDPPMFPRLHLTKSEKGGPRAPPRNKMALCEQLTLSSPKFMPHGPGSSSILCFSSNSSSLVPSTSSSQDGSSYKRSLFSSFHSMPGSTCLAARLDSHNFGGMTVNTSQTTIRQPPEVKNHQILCRRGHLSSAYSRRFTPPSVTNSRTSFVKKLVDEDDYAVPTFSEPSDCANGQREMEREKYASSSTNSHGKLPIACEKQLCHSTRLSQECRIFAENVTTRKRRASTMEGLSISKLSHGDSHQSPNGAEGATQCREEQDCGSTPTGAEKNGDITSTSKVSDLNISPDAVVELIGQKRFWKARRTILHQQRVFSLQVFELHRLIMVQRLLAASPELLVEDSFNLRKSKIELSPMVSKPRVDPLKPAGNTVKRLPAPSNDTDSHKSNLSMVTNAKQEPWCLHPPPGSQWLVPVRLPSEGLVYKPYTGPCPPSAGLLAPMYGSCGAISPSPACGVPEGIGAFSGQTYIPPYVMPILKPSSHSAVELAIHLDRAPSNSTHINFSIPCKVSSSLSRHKKGAIWGCTPKFLERSTGSSNSERAHGGDELPLFPTAPTAEVSDPSGNNSADEGVKVIKVVPHNPKLASESAARKFRSIQEERNLAGCMID